MTALTLAAMLRLYHLRFNAEVDLQDRIAELLEREKVSFVREFSLNTKDRIDFLVDTIGVEVKIDSPKAAVLRQIHRYAQSEAIAGLVVVTSRSKHLQLPDEFSGKPIEVVFTEASL